MAGGAVAVHISDVRFVREPRAVCPADVFGRKRLDAGRLLCVANCAAGFLSGFLVTASGRVADVTFGMRGDGQERGLRSLLMAEIALEFPSCFRQRVCDVQFVLPGVEKRVEIVTLWEVALRWARGQPSYLALLSAVADRASLLGARGELDDVAFDAGFVAGEFQTQLFIAIGRGDYVV